MKASCKNEKKYDPKKYLNYARMDISSVMGIEDSTQQATGNLNAMTVNFYIRSLDHAASCREYARSPFKKPPFCKGRFGGVFEYLPKPPHPLLKAPTSGPC